MSNTVESYEDLIAWQKAMNLVEAVYLATRALPAEERFGLVAQMRRCAVSIPSNIAEGWGRNTTSDYSRFLTMARASLFELATQSKICQRLGFAGDWKTLAAQIDEVRRILTGLINSLCNHDRE